MENTTNNLNSQENQTQTQKPVKQRRPILGDRIYLSHPEAYKCTFQDSRMLFNTLKSNSIDAEPSKEKQVNKPTIMASSNITDSCTQTSKTIIQLAKLEVGHLTPDSLTQSPRDPQPISDKNNLNLQDVESKLQMCPTNSEYTLISSVCENPSNSMTFSRKLNIQEYIDGYKEVDPKKFVTETSSVCEKPSNSLSFSRKLNIQEYIDGYQSRNIPAAEVDIYPKKSLTETFLEKKQIDDQCDCRSRFLQQTSPLRNLSYKNYNDHFKSQSCVESYDPNFLQDDMYMRKLPLPATRFTVKHVKEQQVGNVAQQKYVWSSEESNRTNVKIDKLFQCSDNDSDDYSLRHTRKNSKNRRTGTFMSPTLASELKNQQHAVQHVQNLISPTRRGKSLSPSRRNPSPASNLVKRFNQEKIPYIDQSSSHLQIIEPVVHKLRKNSSERHKSPTMMVPQLATRPKFDEDLLKIDLQSLDIRTSEETIGGTAEPSCSSSTSFDNIVSLTIARIRNRDWAIALRGLAEMTELCRIMDTDMLFPHMTAVNQRLLELLRSSRSHVCRTACQAAGHFFESMKDTRKPEFDDIVEILLCKTADANKFIRKDANLSLDCMVTHIPIFHSVRSLCLKGPFHKNALVRTATIRLIVCAVVIAGPDIVLNLQCHENTRKRIIQQMATFLQDKHQETRKYGERLYKVLCKESMFEPCLKKYLEKNEITRMKSALKNKK